MGSTQQFSLKWNKYQQNWDQFLMKIVKNHLFSDVMVACDGEVFQLHRVVLASCSTYFEKTLQNIPAKETPIVMLSEITEEEMRILIEFMYCGQATIDQTRLESLLKAAERLQIRGLVKSDGDSSCEDDQDDSAEPLPTRPETPPPPPADGLAPSWLNDTGSAAPSTSAPPSPPPLHQQMSPSSPSDAAPLDVMSMLSLSVAGHSDDLPPPFAGEPPPFAGTPPAFVGPPPAFVGPPPAFASATPPFSDAPPPFSNAPSSFSDTPPSFSGARPPFSDEALPFPSDAVPVAPPGAELPPLLSISKRNTHDSPHVRAALSRISAGEVTVAEASIEYDIPIPTLYLNMRRQGVKARGRCNTAGKRKPRGVMSEDMKSALGEIQSGGITASKASRKYNITLPRIMSWMRKMGIKSAHARPTAVQMEAAHAAI